MAFRERGERSHSASRFTKIGERRTSREKPRGGRVREARRRIDDEKAETRGKGFASYIYEDVITRVTPLLFITYRRFIEQDN